MPGFESGKVTRSAKAYALLETPDAVLALGSYSATMFLAAAGSPGRSAEQPLLPLALVAKVGFDAVLGAKYAFDEWSENGRLYSWCLVATVAAIAALPLVIPEARSALRQL